MESESKKCPNCRLINPASAQLCDCGYDFEAGELSEAAKRKAPDTSLIGKKFALIFVLILAWGQAYVTLQEGEYALGRIGTSIAVAILFCIWFVIYKSEGGKEASWLMASLFAIVALIAIVRYSLSHILSS